eukprot:TRINITY_DN1358_c0_g1_i12.p2 TRINITY_DN1358_c0_g1~~TRINITY_DN1358_c0_g1_i12.p2  ORF type:complete len:145 (+),score=55.33 TRINITY_DN1358_c0_g1_i12:240-674(+)
MAFAAPQLLWECTKKNSSFIRKSTNMPVMSADPNNLCGLNSYKFSGVCGGKVLGLSSKKVGMKESIVLAKQNATASRASRPASMIVTTGISKNAKKGCAALDKALSAKYYRGDLVSLAKQKLTKLQASFKKKKRVFKAHRTKTA